MDKFRITRGTISSMAQLLDVPPSNDNNQNNKAKLDEAVTKCRSLEHELEELKENYEFINSENIVLQEFIKELEQTSFQERKEWQEEKKKFEDAIVYSKQLYIKHKELEEKMQKLVLEDKSSKEKIEELQTEQLKSLAFIDQLKDILFQKDSTTNLSSTSEQTTITDNEASDSSLPSYDINNKIIEKVKSLVQPSSETTNDESKEQTNQNEITNEKFSQLMEELKKVESERNVLESKYEELKNAFKNDANYSPEKINHLEKIAALKSQLEDQKAETAIIIDKYVRHRAVFQNNEENFAKEIEKMDNFISNIFQCLKSMPDSIKETTEMKNFLKLYDEQMMMQKDCN